MWHGWFEVFLFLPFRLCSHIDFKIKRFAGCKNSFFFKWSLQGQKLDKTIIRYNLIKKTILIQTFQKHWYLNSPSGQNCFLSCRWRFSVIISHFSLGVSNRKQLDLLSSLKTFHLSRPKGVFSSEEFHERPVSINNHPSVFVFFCVSIVNSCEWWP